MNVRMFKGDKTFVDACKMASTVLGKEILPTWRQYKKWLKRMGSAWNHGRNLQEIG